ncbi:hypothetical protein SLE2022_179920 [Rubroshorea leprosula]
MAYFQKKRNSHEFINKRRWSNSIPQLNIFSTCEYLNKERSDKEGGHKEGGLANGDLFDILSLRSLLRKVRRNQWVQFESFVKDREWQFIFTTLVKKLLQNKDMGGKDLKDMKLLVRGYLNGLFKKLDTTYIVISSSLEEFGHMESLLMWHTATEYYYRKEVPVPKSTFASTSTSTNIDHQKVCKLLSDYMFYLLVMEPSMIAVSPNSWKMVLKGENCITLGWLKDLKDTDSAPRSIFKRIKDRLLENIEGIIGREEESTVNKISKVKETASDLVKALKKVDN